MFEEHWFMKYQKTKKKQKTKNIGLWNIYRQFLREKKKKLIILKAFYIFYKNYIKTFLK